MALLILLYSIALVCYQLKQFQLIYDVKQIFMNLIWNRMWGFMKSN